MSRHTEKWKQPAFEPRPKAMNKILVLFWNVSTLRTFGVHRMGRASCIEKMPTYQIHPSYRLKIVVMRSPCMHKPKLWGLMRRKPDPRIPRESRLVRIALPPVLELDCSRPKIDTDPSSSVTAPGVSCLASRRYRKLRHY
jgi:hypothetical protein